MLYRGGRGPYFLTAVVRASLGSHVGKPSSAYGWSGVFFSQVHRFSPTFDERSARYRWNILERAVKPKSKKKKKKKKKKRKEKRTPMRTERVFVIWAESIKVDGSRE